MSPDETDVGATLRAARERQGIALAAIARSLHIPEKTLRAIEEGNFALLPPAVYVRGFLKQYAAVLGLDAVPLVRAYDVERARAPVVAPHLPVSKRGHMGTGWWELVTPRSVTLLLGALALALVLLYVVWQVRTYVRAPRLEVLEPSGQTEVTSSSLTVHGRTDPTADVTINGERTVIREDGTFEELVALGEGVSTLRIVAKSIGDRETVVTREVLARPVTASPASGAQSPTSRTGLFAFSAKAGQDAVWVSLTVDGKVAFAGLLLPGSEQTVSGTTVTVTTGKANQTLLRVDGEDRGPLAPDPGVVRDATFTRNPTTGTVERRASASSAPTPTPSPPP